MKKNHSHKKKMKKVLDKNTSSVTSIKKSVYMQSSVMNENLHGLRKPAKTHTVQRIPSNVNSSIAGAEALDISRNSQRQKIS